MSIVTTTSSTPSGPVAILRPSRSRGNADHGWLRSYHIFSFASYWSPVKREQEWGSLRVLNEDVVSPNGGFPTHSHREFEIFSLVLRGTIDHADSVGNAETLKRGAVQMTSTGTGIAHSEYNGGKFREDLHFLQCWAKPHTKGLKPSYYTRHFSDAEKLNVLLPIVAPIDSSPAVVNERNSPTGPAPIHSPLTVLSSILSPHSSVSHTFGNVKGYVHLPMASGYRKPSVEAPVEGVTLKVVVGREMYELREGDGLYLDQVKGIEVFFVGGGGGGGSGGERDTEFFLFDLE